MENSEGNRQLDTYRLLRWVDTNSTLRSRGDLRYGLGYLDDAEVQRWAVVNSVMNHMAEFSCRRVNTVADVSQVLEIRYLETRPYDRSKLQLITSGEPT
jgi:hypothetical protein